MCTARENEDEGGEINKQKGLKKESGKEEEEKQSGVDKNPDQNRANRDSVQKLGQGVCRAKPDIWMEETDTMVDNDQAVDGGVGII